MGFNLQWIAIAGIEADAAQKLLDVTPTGEREEFPESDLVGTLMENGWYLVVSNSLGFMVDDQMLRAASAAHHVVSCGLVESTMFSQARSWKDGAEVWAVTHESDQGIKHLDASGALPSRFGELRDAAFGKQSEADRDEVMVDYVFDVPIDLAEHITGFRHDGFSSDEPEFEVLTMNSPPSKLSFLRRLFR